MDTINEVHRFLRKFMARHGSFERDDLPDWMNLFWFVFSCFGRKDLAVNRFLKMAVKCKKVMQTISSRCQSIRLLPLSREEISGALTGRFGYGEDDAARAVLVCGGSLGVALRYLSDSEDYYSGGALFRALLENVSSRDLSAALECGEEAASLSREKQKAFCIFAGDSLRKIFLRQQDLPSISGISHEEEGFYSGMAASCRKTFPRNAMAVIDRSQMLLDRNVNPKIVFCDLVNRLYTLF